MDSEAVVDAECYCNLSGTYKRLFGLTGGRSTGVHGLMPGVIVVDGRAS
jgi:hypothetical protein